MTKILRAEDKAGFDIKGTMYGSSLIKAALTILSVAAIFLMAGAYNVEAASVCRSQANATEQATAEKFCERKLKCSKKTPPQEISCVYQANRWTCRCKKKKSGGSLEFGIQFGIGTRRGGERKNDAGHPPGGEQRY